MPAVITRGSIDCEQREPLRCIPPLVVTDEQLAQQVIDGGRLRATLLELWQRTRMDWGFVTDRLSTTFRKETWIGAHERRFLGEVLYGLVRHLRRIDAALDRGARSKAKRAPRDLERLLALLVLEKLIEPARAARLEPDTDWSAVATIDSAIATERDLATRIGLAYSFPDWLAKRLVADWGERAEALARSLNERAPMTVRANLLVGDRVALASELARDKLGTRDGRLCDTALILESRINLFGTPAFKRGAMEAQDEGSQLLADLATAGLSNTKPLIIDLCAGAGGKTLAIAGRLGNRGRIVATDVDSKKLEELRKRARRATVSNARAVQLDGGGWPKELDSVRGKADVVLVDAPCSGLGSLRRNPEARWRLRETDLADFAKRQLGILRDATDLLAPGGRLVYATCTLLRVENQEVVTALLAAKPALSRVPLAEVLGDRAPGFDQQGDFVTAPDTHGTDGFFASVLRHA
jgi:16S rRNA (cytosine967-C5)-methyltransferase